MNQEIDTFESICAGRGEPIEVFDIVSPPERDIRCGKFIPSPDPVRERRNRGGAMKKKRPKKPKGWKSDGPTPKERTRHRAWCHYKGVWVPYLEYKAMARNYSTRDS